jgi:hypothetical protein
VEPAELDNALEELEVRVERLRALYEQYFLGIEKVEPSVVRKDVDRRIWTLRREQIRNTGKRFKLNTIIQRYNTFQQYWMRICREIENGTYRRHLLRARKNLEGKEALTIAARKRVRMLERGERMAAERAARAAAGADEVERQLEADLSDRPPRTLDAMDEVRRAMDEALGSSELPAAQSGAAQASIPLAPAVPAEALRDRLEPLQLGLNEGPALPTGSASTPASANSDRPGRDRPTPVQLPPARPLGAREPRPRSRRPPLGPTAAQDADARSHGPLTQRPLPAPKSRLGQARRPPGVGAAGPDPGTAPDGPPPASPAGQAANAPAAADGPRLSDQRIRQLHSQLLDAKQRTNDAATVSEEALAKSLRAAEVKLRQQHGSSRRVDFDIVIKNGKAVVKPIVR